MQDVAPVNIADTFNGVRPSIVCGEGTAENVLADDVVMEHSLKNVAELSVSMSNSFQEQFIPQYFPRAFPWTLNYDCGGAEYPDLFRSEDAGDERQPKQTWRRLDDEAILSPAEYAALLASRPEIQVAGDWLLVPGARSLHWRFTVLRKSFLLCKAKITPGQPLQENLDDLIAATQRLWKRIKTDVATIRGRKMKMNGNTGMLFQDASLSATERMLLGSYFRVTSCIAGSQAVRTKIGHCLFGFRVVYGEGLFVTISPNRHHSALVMKLSRARRNDVSLEKNDGVANARRQFCGSDEPNAFTTTDVLEDPDGEEVSLQLPMPPLQVRQAWNAEDPLACVHHFLFVMYVLIPAAFGIRMCLHCPDCNGDCTDSKWRPHNPDRNACSDYMGNNHKFMGGYAGIAVAMAFAVEFQKTAAPHAHGFVSLANMYQHNHLENIAEMLQ